jgi:GrxC family glutaredoxin
MPACLNILGEEIFMSKIVIYTIDYCPYCRKAKELLDQLKVKYEEIDISKNEAQMRLMLAEKTGGKQTVPQIFVDDKLIGGYDAISTLHEKGELEKLLK